VCMCVWICAELARVPSLALAPLYLATQLLARMYKLWPDVFRVAGSNRDSL
jgi:hypothetical protein